MNSNCAIFWRPSSETSNSSGLRSRTTFPCASVATTSTVTRRVWTCNAKPGGGACCGGGGLGDCCWAGADDTEGELGDEACPAAFTTVAAAKRTAEPTTKFFARIGLPSSFISPHIICFLAEAARLGSHARWPRHHELATRQVVSHSLGGYV